MRPLFFEFTDDEECYSDDVLNKEFMIGDALLITPVLQAFIFEIEPYFPGRETVWYDIQTGKGFSGEKKHWIMNTLNAKC